MANLREELADMGRTISQKDKIIADLKEETQMTQNMQNELEETVRKFKLVISEKEFTYS